MKHDKCYIKGCRGETVIKVLGDHMCNKHWEEYCDCDGKS